MGALRFTESEKGDFLANEHKTIPPLVELPTLLSASERYEDEHETAHDLKILLAPGSSLGGARPKASVLDKDNALAIAKFPNKHDEYNTILWEMLALILARKANIRIPECRIEKVRGKPIFISKRFDQQGQQRIPYLSAISMLGANDNEPRSYCDIVDAIRQHGAHVQKDFEELWRRMVFNILISNTDDHLRNHGFLYKTDIGWTLSPAFDLNPVPVDIKPRIPSTTIDFHDGTASLALAMSVAPYFNLSQQRAVDISTEVRTATQTWRQEAKKLGIAKLEVDRMASAFEHKDEC